MRRGERLRRPAARPRTPPFGKRVAEAGRLRVDEDRATQILHAAGRGITLTLLTAAPPDRDLELSALAREAVIASITTGPAVGKASNEVPLGPAVAAVTLRASLPRVTTLSTVELALLDERLARIAHEPAPT